MNELSKSIVSDRQQAGLTQDQLAKRLGVSQQAVSNWEEGKSIPRGKRLRELSSLFGSNSQTAVVTQEINKHTHRSTLESETTMRQSANMPGKCASMEPITALTQAAADIATAAKALATSAEQIAQAVIRLTRDH